MSKFAHLSDDQILQAAGLKTAAPAASPSGGNFAHLSDEDILKAAGLPAPATTPAGNATGAALEGFGNGASLGYLPQLQAAAAKPIYAALNAVTGQDVQPDSYLQERDANIARQESLAKSNPKSYYGGMLAGGIATAPVLEAGVTALAPAKLISVTPAILKAAAAGDEAAKAAVLAAQARKAMTIGGAIGAAANPGDKEGELAPVQPGKRLVNAGIGIGLGAAGNKIASKIAGAPEALASTQDGLETLAEKNALRSIGAQKTQMKQLLKSGGPDKVKEVGRFVINESLAPAGAGVEEIAENAQRVKKAAGEQIGAVFDKIDSSGNASKFDRKTIAQAMRDALTGDEDVSGSLHSKKVMPQLEELITDFESKPGAADARELLKLKGQYDKEINYAKKAMDLPALQQGYKNIRTTINEAINERAEALSNKVRGQLGDELRAANKRYSLASSASEIAENKLAQEGNNFFSLTDKMAGGVGALAGMTTGGITSIPKAAAAMMASKALRTYGPAVGTSALDAAAGAAGKASSLASKAGSLIPSAVAKAAKQGAQAAESASGELAPAAREVFTGSTRPAFDRAAGARASSAESDQPAKGETKWANDGLKKLMEHGRNPAELAGRKAELLADPKIRQLLINASDLKPGSKAMDKILEKVRASAASPKSR